MPKFRVAVDHAQDRHQIVERLQSFADEVRSNAPTEVRDVREEWDDQGNLNFSFVAMGFKVDGSVVTCSERVTVSGQLPFAALPFRGKIEQTIREQLLVVIR